MHMSNAAIDWAVASKVRGVAKSVLFVLANRADDNGKCFPSVPTICDECGFSERAVRDAIRQLEREKYIAVHHSWGKQTVYELCQTPARGAPHTPAGDAGRHIPPPAADANDPGAKCHQPRRETPPTPAGNAYITQIEPKKNPKLTQNGRASTSDGFDLFWANYPRKVGKGQAERAWRAAVKKVSADQITASMLAYPFDRSRPEYIPHASTWLNGERWADRIEAPRPRFQNGFLELARMAQQGEEFPEVDNPVADFLRLPHVH